MSILEHVGPLPCEVLRYDDREDALIDVYLPDVAVETLVVFVHGGFWRTLYDRAHARSLAHALARDGFAVALPEYRRVGPGRGSGGGWPTTCHDVQRATVRLPELLSGIGVTARRTVLSGHSAGGHLVLWLAGVGTPADAVVPLAPVGDLGAAAAIRMGDGAVQAFLGGAEVPAEADPAALLGRLRPPYPITILHGVEDDVVTIENSRGLVAQHPWIGLHELPAVDHFDLIDPESPAYPWLVRGFSAT